MRRIGLIPFYKLTLAWSLGILINKVLQLTPNLAFWSIWVLLTICTTVFVIFKIAVKPSLLGIKSLAFYGFVWFTSVLINSKNNQPALNINEPLAAKTILLRATTNSTARQNGLKIVAKVIAHNNSLEWKKTQNPVGAICYLKGKNLNPINAGDEFIIPAKNIGTVKAPSNPNQFNYKAYLANKNIFFQAFIDSNEYVLTHRVSSFSLITTFTKIRTWMLGNLAFLNNETRGVAEALVLGYKENLDQNVKSTFSQTGTMHILAVSGLHVGIIYKVVDWLLFLLLKFKRGKQLKIATLLLVLWSYALLTGLPPSVMRASFMFSLITIGSTLNRPNNVFNNVFASAFFLLIYDANLLFDVGFQLSYSAVIGILVFQPFFAKIWYVKNPIIKFFWDLITVSFAAQLAVAPLTIYYFNQLPLIFPISNLIAIPGAFAIVALGGVLQLANLISDKLTYIIEIIYQFILQILVDSIAWLSTLPFTHLAHLKIDILQLYMLVIFVALLYGVLLNRSKKALFAGLILLLLVTCYSNYKKYWLEPHIQWALIDSYKTTAIAVKKQKQGSLVFLNQQANIGYETQGFFVECKNIDTVATHKNNAKPYIKRNRNLIAIGNDVVYYNPIQRLKEVDYYIFSKNSLPDNLSDFNAKKCIFDASIKPNWVLKNNPKFATAHFVQKDGAFIKLKQ
ncbi:MAG: ComEC/Rec2 family competence protein [Bacteroidia bacterium]